MLLTIQKPSQFLYCFCFRNSYFWCCNMSLENRYGARWVEDYLSPHDGWDSKSLRQPPGTRHRLFMPESIAGWPWSDFVAGTVDNGSPNKDTDDISSGRTCRRRGRGRGQPKKSRPVMRRRTMQRTSKLTARRLQASGNLRFSVATILVPENVFSKRCGCLKDGRLTHRQIVSRRCALLLVRRFTDS